MRITMEIKPIAVEVEGKGAFNYQGQSMTIEIEKDEIAELTEQKKQLAAFYLEQLKPLLKKFEPIVDKGVECGLLAAEQEMDSSKRLSKMFESTTTPYCEDKTAV